MKLESAIRDFVLLPIVVVMLLVQSLRFFAGKLLRTSAKPSLVHNVLARANLMKRPVAMDYEAFQSRISYLCFVLANPPPENNDPTAMLEPMTQMLTSTALMFIPQTIIMSWVSWFFSGFVIAKLPFPLTVRFKSMLQSGIETQDMDVRWISSLSWYFLNLFGLSSVFSLMFDETGQNNFQMQQPMQQPMRQPGELERIFKAEAENLMAAEFCFAFEGIENRILERFEPLTL